MSYLRLLDQARNQLARGDLLGAERLLAEATEAWKGSRVRAPLVERGIEPALRGLGRMFGRKSTEPVLPVYARKAELLREDLDALARSLADEALESLESADIRPSQRVGLCAEALNLQRNSEVFSLGPGQEWAVVRQWLTDCRDLGLALRVDLLPATEIPKADEGWWLEWLEDWCEQPREPVRSFASWARGMAVACQARAGLDKATRWSWVEARLAMLDPLAGPFAMPAVNRVLDAMDESTLVRPALQAWAELVTNLRVLATPGGNAREELELRSMQAARACVPWPPEDVIRQLDSRRPSSGAPVLVAVEWHDDAAAVVFVLHDGRKACDALCVKPGADPDPQDPFAMDEARAQRKIAAWMPPEAVLISAREPGPRLRGLVASSRWIALDELSALSGCGEPGHVFAAPVVDHPAWTREVCAPWDTLVPVARRHILQLEELLEFWPSLTTPWGRDNLMALGRRGIPLGEALAVAGQLCPTASSPSDLVRTSAPTRLIWPSMEHRPWPALRVEGAGATAFDPLPPGHVWLDRRARADELAAAAVHQGPAILYTVGQERAVEILDAAARVGDARKVALVGSETPCAAPLLDLLNRWVSESIEEPSRARAAIWLLCLLSETAGILEPLLARSGNPELVEEVRARIAPCGGECESHEEVGCWPEQMRVRCDASHVTVLDVACSEVAVASRRRVLVDDLRDWVVEVDDAEALRRLEAIPCGPEPLTVFTPGIGFVPALLDSIPLPVDRAAGWEFRPGPATPMTILAAGDGYGPGSDLLAREARSLVEERVKRWISDVGDAPVWGTPVGDILPGVSGVADEPGHDTVLVTALTESSEPTAIPAIIVALRLAAAASHARERVVCLSPVLAEAFHTSAGVVQGEDQAPLPRALDNGAILLSARRGRQNGSWASPLTRPRLEARGAQAPRALASALERWEPGRARILAGVTEADRRVIVELLEQLQAEARDGGPLGVRSVVQVVPDSAAGVDAVSAELRLRALDRGRAFLTRLSVSEFDSSGVEDWARRSPGVAWVFRNAESLPAGESRVAVARILAAIRRAGARSLLFADRETDARAVREFVAPQLALDPIAVIDTWPEQLDTSAWSRRELGPLRIRCGSCRRPVEFTRAFELCPDCGVPVDDGDAARRALCRAFEERIVDSLAARGPRASWTVVVFSEDRAARLRLRTGLHDWADADTPLLDQAGPAEFAEVLVPEELWLREELSAPVIVCGVPGDVETWSRLEARLRALGAQAGDLWLPPPGMVDEEADIAVHPGAEVERAVREGSVLVTPVAPIGQVSVSLADPLIGIAGWGKTYALAQLAMASANSGRPVLVVVPTGVHRLEWAERVHDPRVSCVSIEELLLEFVAACDPAWSGLRLLPSAGRRAGEEVRLDLVRSASRLYEEEAGELPALDARALMRAVEGELVRSAAAAGASPGSNDALLAACIERARQDAGWIDSTSLVNRASELLASPRHPVPKWAEEFGTVLVDDAHDLEPQQEKFMGALFGDRVRCRAVDPVLGQVPDELVGDRTMVSRRFRSPIAEAIEKVWRAATPLPGRVRGIRGSGAGSGVSSERALALRAAIERIAEDVREGDRAESVGIVLANERDRRAMEQQLSLRGVPIASSFRVAEDLVSGPREILAALAWSFVDSGADRAGLLEILIQAGPQPGQAIHASHYDERLRSHLAGETPGVLDRVEAFLMPLVLIGGAITPATRVDRAVEALLHSGVLSFLQSQPAFEARIAGFVRSHQQLGVEELLEIVPVDRILRPASGGARVQVLAPDELGGREFDRIHYLCTGFEPPRRHYRVLSRARSSVRIVCSEVDPLQG